MYRVALAAGLATSLAGCSLGSTSLSSGFAEQETTTSALSSPALSPSFKGVGLGGDPAAPREEKVAAIDKAPSGSYERAAPGVLSDRDYSHTALNAEMARDIINAYRKKHGLKPLKLNAELTEAAKAHSRDLAKWDRISHYGSDGSNPWDRSEARRLPCASDGGERRDRSGRLQRSDARLGGKPRPQQKPPDGGRHEHGHRVGAGSKDGIQILLDTRHRRADVKSLLHVALRERCDQLWITGSSPAME